MSDFQPSDVLRLLPHRHPFLLVDRIDEVVPGERIVATKNVSFGEPYFEGHFPGNPVMPGVLQIEALAQAAAILGFHTHPDVLELGGGVALLGLDKVRFRRKVVPGDVLRLEVTLLQARGDTWKVQGKASVDGEPAAEARILAAFQRPGAAEEA